jgi:hypothetical protein
MRHSPLDKCIIAASDICRFLGVLAETLSSLRALSVHEEVSRLIDCVSLSFFFPVFCSLFY